MFNDDSERTNVLRKVSTALNANGYVLIADIPKHKALIRDYFDNPQWTNVLDKKGFTFVKNNEISGKKLPPPDNKGLPLSL